MSQLRVGGVPSGPTDSQVVIGQVPHWSSQNKFAASTVISTSWVDIWANASILSYLSSSELMNIVSTDVNDDDGDTGARTVYIEGLDDDYNVISETLTLNGTTNVPSVNSYLRVYRMQVITVGTSEGNEGVITSTAVTAGTVQSYISVGDSQTLQSQYTVQADKYLILTRLEISTQNSDQARIRLCSRKIGEAFQVKRSYNVYQTIKEMLISPPLLFPPKTDITMRAIKIAGGGNVDASCAYDFYLVDSSEVSV